MADLSTILVTEPANVEAVSQGASRIRETRDAIVTSFAGVDTGSGTTTSEHYKKGAHKFLSGAPGALPSAGNNGRIFLDTTNTVLMRDNGSAWTMLNAVSVGSVSVATQVLIPNTNVATTVATLNIATVLAGSRIAMLVSVLDIQAFSVAATATFSLTAPGTPVTIPALTPLSFTKAVPVSTLEDSTCFPFLFLSGIAAGNYTLKCTWPVAGAGNLSLIGSSILAFQV